MADCINFPCHGDSCRVFENLMQSAILFLAVKVAKVGPEYWVQPSPDSAVYLKWLIALILISRRGIEWLIALIFPVMGILAVYLKI